MAAAQPTSYGDAAMDAALWGQLQSYIDLAIIYVKVPLAPFFRLRQVRKEWNRLASDRQFLERTFKLPVANPFFVVTIRGMDDRLLTCQASSWSSMPLPRVKCEVSGLLLIYRCETDSDHFRIFDLHTRVFHAVPPIPATMMQVRDYTFFDPLIGMIVDTTLIPYSFRIILADEVIGTRIYDSKSGAWMQKPSTYKHSMRAVDCCVASCVSHNRFFYVKVPIRKWTTFDLHAYDLQRDEWNYNTPQVIEAPQWEFRGIGVWRDRLFVFGRFVIDRKLRPAVAIWELDHRLKEPWILFHSIPEELYAWITSYNNNVYNYIQSKFCNEHVLLYNAMGDEGKAVLYNLDCKTWERFSSPALSRYRQQQLLQWKPHASLISTIRCESVGNEDGIKEQFVHSMLFSPK